MKTRHLFFIPLTLLFFAFAAHAQEPRPVTYDDINAVASQMYCPDCENVPLDKCFTSVCAQWKREIEAELVVGASSEQIVAGFVARFGDQVVGVPQDPFLRNIALIAPVVFLILTLAVGGYAIWSRLPGRNDVAEMGEMPMISQMRTPHGASVQDNDSDAQISDGDASEHPVRTTHGLSPPENPAPSATQRPPASPSDAKYLAQLKQDVDRE